LLAGLGGVAGVAVAIIGVQLLAGLVPESMPRLKAIRLDATALGFTLLISLATGLAFGCVPALSAGRTRLNEALKQAGAQATTGLNRRRFRGTLVVLELALALVLLTGAGLMIGSVLRLLHVDPGFDLQNLLRVDLQLPWEKYNTPEQGARATQLRQTLYAELHERLTALPGIRSAGLGKHGAWPEKLKLDGRDEPAEVLLDGCGVGESDLFRAMRVPLRAGRYFEARDTGAGVGTAIINETMARTFWPGEDAVGKRFTREAWRRSPQYEVVGVVADVRDARYDLAPRPTFYRPCHELDLTGFAPFFVIRTGADPRLIVSAVRKELSAAEPAMRAPRVTVCQQVLYDSTQAQRTYMVFLVVFAVIGLLLAALGIYGVLAYAVARRTREIGIRMALGAERRRVLMMILVEGGRLVAAGITLGLVAAFWLTRLLRQQLFEVNPTEPGIFIVVVAVLTGIAMLACLLPARRAAQVHPMEALRYE
jgi:predicted permease